MELPSVGAFFCPPISCRTFPLPGLCERGGWQPREDRSRDRLMITGQDRVTARGPAMYLTLGPLWALTCELPHGEWTSFCTSFSGSRLMGILGIVLWTLYPSIKGQHSGITCICEISFLSYYKTNRTHISKFIISLVFESYQLTCYPQKSICGWYIFISISKIKFL